LDINPVLFRTKKPVAIYLQYRLGDQITRFQLTKQSYPIKFVEEKAISRVPYKQEQAGNKRALYIVTDTQPNTVKNADEPVQVDEDGNDLIYDEDLEPLREYDEDLQNSPLPGENAENAGDANNLSFSRQEGQDDPLIKDVVKVVKVNKAKVSYYFTERIPDM